MVFSWTFVAWFYALVFFEQLLRWILKHFVGHHKDTRRPYSLVNAMDPYFDGFCSLPTKSAAAAAQSSSTFPCKTSSPGEEETPSSSTGSLKEEAMV